MTTILWAPIIHLLIHGPLHSTPSPPGALFPAPVIQAGKAATLKGPESEQSTATVEAAAPAKSEERKDP